MFSFCRTYRQAKKGIVGIKYSRMFKFWHRTVRDTLMGAQRGLQSVLRFAHQNYIPASKSVYRTSQTPYSVLILLTPYCLQPCCRHSQVIKRIHRATMPGKRHRRRSEPLRGLCTLYAANFFIFLKAQAPTEPYSRLVGVWFY